jgi:transposase-like protein
VGLVLRWKDVVMPKAYPQEFREDVVRIARQGELTYAQIARDFGISETCVSNWVRKADVEDGQRPGTTAAEAAELRETRKRIRVLEQENEILRRAAVYLGRGTLPK